MTQLNDTIESKSNSEELNGVNKEFITSYGTYLVLRFMKEAEKNGVNTYVHHSKKINFNDIETIMGKFKSSRIIKKDDGYETVYEAVDEKYGYIAIEHNKGTPKIAKIKICIGYKEFNDFIETFGKNIEPEPMASWVTGVDNYGDLVTKELSIKSIHEYHSEFYPSMNGESIESFAKRYVESESSILLLIGEPGTAKTNFIRQLLSATKESVLLTYSEDIKQEDKLFSHFYDSPEKFLVIEDADTYIASRNSGNTNMKQLLNITDGLTANPEKKVIFSTNLPSISHVDKALTRAGRCFKVLDFSKLSGDYLDKACKVIDIDNYDPKGKYTIAELFELKNNKVDPIKAKEVETVGEVFGFTPPPKKK